MLAVFGRIGVLSFGGPAAQIALMHRVLVEEERWLDEANFLNALSFCMLLPGPEAMQLATYAGWQLRGVRGGLLAGLLFVLPGALVVLAMAMLYLALGNLPIIKALFVGVQSAVLVLVVDALLQIARKALHSMTRRIIAGMAFIAIFFFTVSFPVIILASGLVGFFWLGHRIPPRAAGHPLQPIARTVRTVGFWLLVWWLPLVFLRVFGGNEILVELGYFFSRLAVVTFGGAYAVLAYLAQDVVTHHGWLSTREMVDGLGLAETTPGPLILVTEFVGYLAGYRVGGIGLGIAGALVALWATFVPCFLWIFAGAPYIERLTAQPRWRGALESITAAVVGVILNLFVWFSLHVLFAQLLSHQVGPLKVLVPVWYSLDWRVLVIALVCAVLLLWWHRSLPMTLFLAALLGMGFGVIGLL